MSSRQADTPRVISASTSASLSLSLCSMCSLLVAMNVCRRGVSASVSASQAARDVAEWRVRQRPAISQPAHLLGDAAARSSPRRARRPGSRPRSRRRPSFSSMRAMRSFSSRVMVAPGDCSPSRSVVSKMRTCSEVLIDEPPSADDPLTYLRAAAQSTAALPGADNSPVRRPCGREASRPPESTGRAAPPATPAVSRRRKVLH